MSCDRPIDFRALQGHLGSMPFARSHGSSGSAGRLRRYAAALLALTLVALVPLSSPAAGWGRSASARGSIVLPVVIAEQIIATLKNTTAALGLMRNVVGYAQNADRLAGESLTLSRRAIADATSRTIVTDAVTATVAPGSATGPLVATCPPGDQAVAGGGTPADTSADTPLIGSVPTSSGTGWAVVWRNDSSAQITDGSWSVRAVCAPAS